MRRMRLVRDLGYQRYSNAWMFSNLKLNRCRALRSNHIRGAVGVAGNEACIQRPVEGELKFLSTGSGTHSLLE